MEEISKEERLKKFILDNKLDFKQEGSALNSVCCTISGFALYIGMIFENDIENVIDELDEDAGGWYENELERVFEFATKNNYGEWWKTPYAKEQYKF